MHLEFLWSAMQIQKCSFSHICGKLPKYWVLIACAATKQWFYVDTPSFQRSVWAVCALGLELLFFCWCVCVCSLQVFGKHADAQHTDMHQCLFHKSLPFWAAILVPSVLFVLIISMTLIFGLLWVVLLIIRITSCTHVPRFLWTHRDRKRHISC